MNQHQENISNHLNDELDKKNSPNQVEAKPDKQIIFEDEKFSISLTNIKKIIRILR